MPNRTATFVSAILVSSLASLALITESHSVTQAAESCLSGPKGTPPQGGHWYYRVDRVTKRHCWYVGDARARLARVSPPSSSSSAIPLQPQKELAAQSSIADARAELPMPQARIEQSIDVGAAQRMTATSTDAAIKDNNATPDGAKLLRQAFASRWPDPSNAPSSTIPTPATGKSVSNARLDSEAVSSVTAAVPLPAADSSSQIRTGSIQMLLLVIVGALAVAGIMGSVIFRFGTMRSAARTNNRDRRGAIWDSIDTHGPSPVSPRAGFRTRREVPGPNDRIAEMLSRLSRSAVS